MLLQLVQAFLLLWFFRVVELRRFFWVLVFLRFF